MKAKSLFAVTALALASMAATAAPQYVVTDLGLASGAGAAQGFAISSSGNYTFGRDVVGRSSAPGFTEATGGSHNSWPMTSPNVFLAPYAGGINTAGVAVAGAGTTAFGSNALPVMYKNGVLSNLALPAGYTTGIAQDVNNSGQAVGQVGTGDDQRAAYFSTFRQAASVITDTAPNGSFMTQAKSINDNGWVIGSGRNVNGETVGIVFDGNNKMVDLGKGIIPTGISENGLVIGTDSNTGMGFTWSAAAGYMSTGITGSTSSINDAGWYIGKSGAGSNAAYVYDGTGAYPLDSLLAGSGWNFTNSQVNVAGIANNGSIIVTALDANNVPHALLLTAVPEPSTYALMLAGLVGVGAIARRRSAAKA